MKGVRHSRAKLDIRGKYYWYYIMNTTVLYYVRVGFFDDYLVSPTIRAVEKRLFQVDLKVMQNCPEL